MNNYLNFNLYIPGIFLTNQSPLDIDSHQIIDQHFVINVEDLFHQPFLPLTIQSMSMTK